MGELSKESKIVTKYAVTENKKGSIRILLAEDNPTNQLVAVKILEKMGFKAEAVDNGAEAVKALEKNDYDLVLMDVQMPELDGYETARKIRDKSTPVLNHNIPIIAMTAHAMSGDKEKCLAAGMDGYVSKPVIPEELSNAINEQLKNIMEDEELPLDKTILPVSDLFDKNTLLARFGGDHDFLKEVFTVFLEDIPKQLNNLRSAVNDRNFDLILLHAHTLKGMSGNINADNLRKCAADLESMGRDKFSNGLDDKLEEVDYEINRIIEYIRKEMNNEDSCS